MKNIILRISKFLFDKLVTSIIWILVTIEEINLRSRWFQIDHPVISTIIFIAIVLGGLLLIEFSFITLGILLIILAVIIAFQVTML